MQQLLPLSRKKRFLWLALLLLNGTLHPSSHAIEIEMTNLRTENELLKNTFYDVVDALFTHGGHWQELNREASSYWRDPTPVALVEKVNQQVENIKEILSSAFF